MLKINKLATAIYLSVLLLTISGCNGAAEDSTIESGGDQESPQNVPYYSAQVLLGPLRSANVEIYEWPNVEGAPVYTTLTSANASIYDANGLFDIPSNILANEKLYLIRVSGGEDIDSNVDGIADAIAVTNDGVLHAVMSSEQIRQNNVTVTVLTELIYQRIAYMLAARYESDAITDEINRLSRLLVKIDINGDQRVDGSDLVLWKPNTFNSALFLPDNNFTPIAQDIRSNTSITEKAAEMTDYVFSSFRGRDSILSTTGGSGKYFFTNGDGLNVFDISDPINAQTIDVSGVIDANLLAQVHLQDNLLFAATADGSVRVYDINYLTYRLMGQAAPLVPSGIPADIAINGNTLYVLQSSMGAEATLFIYTIAEDISLNYVNAITLPPADRMLIIGNYMYLATEGLSVYDLADPQSPVPVGSPVAIPGNISGMLAKDSYILASNYETGLTVFDLRTPNSPQLLDTKDFGFRASNISLNGDSAYLENFGLVAIDVSNPTMPQRIAKIATPGVDQSPSGQILFDGAYAFIPSGYLVYVSNLDAPGDFTLFSSLTELGDVTRLGEDPNNLYIFNYPSLDQPTLSILDATNTAHPQVITSIPLASRGDNITRAGDYIYVATGTGGVTIVNVSNTESAFVEGTFADSSGTVTDVAVFADFAFVAVRNYGLEIYDISIPDAPVLSSTLTSLRPVGQINQLVVKDNILTMFDGLNILLINISNPTLISDTNLADFITSEVPVPGNPNDIRIFGDKMFAIAYDFDLHSYRIFAIDLADPTGAFIQSEISTSLNAFSSTFDGRFLYVAEYEEGLRVYDYADMLNPHLAYIIETPGRSLDIRLRNNEIYLADNSGGLNIYKKIVSPVP